MTITFNEYNGKWEVWENDQLLSESYNLDTLRGAFPEAVVDETYETYRLGF